MVEQALEVPQRGPEPLHGVGDHGEAVHHARQPYCKMFLPFLNVWERLEQIEHMADEKKT